MYGKGYSWKLLSTIVMDAVRSESADAADLAVREGEGGVLIPDQGLVVSETGDMNRRQMIQVLTALGLGAGALTHERETKADEPVLLAWNDLIKRTEYGTEIVPEKTPSYKRYTEDHPAVRKLIQEESYVSRDIVGPEKPFAMRGLLLWVNRWPGSGKLIGESDEDYRKRRELITEVWPMPKNGLNNTPTLFQMYHPPKMAKYRAGNEVKIGFHRYGVAFGSQYEERPGSLGAFADLGYDKATSEKIMEYMRTKL